SAADGHHDGCGSVLALTGKRSRSSAPCRERPSQAVGADDRAVRDGDERDPPADTGLDGEVLAAAQRTHRRAAAHRAQATAPAEEEQGVRDVVLAAGPAAGPRTTTPAPRSRRRRRANRGRRRSRRGVRPQRSGASAPASAATTRSAPARWRASSAVVLPLAATTAFTGVAILSAR